MSAPDIVERVEGRPAAVLFDVGNVIVRWDPLALYSKVFPDAADRDRFLTEVCTLDWHAAHDAGVAMAENSAPLIARFPEHAENIRAWDARFDEMLYGTIPETEAVIEDLHARGVPLYALTNMPAEKADYAFSLSPVFRCFRDIVVSGVERVIKPDRRIYEIACERSGFPPEAMLFVDDSEANIEAARGLGFHVWLFRDPAALRPELERLGLL